MTDGGVALRPKGAVGLLHRKGSPVRCWRAKRRDWWRDSHCVRRELRLCCTGGESPPFQFNARRGLARRKKGSHCNRREPAALLRREWEPRPPPSAQRNSEWRTEASHCDRREPWVCCTGRGAPSDAEKAKRRDWWRDSHCVRRELRLCCTGGESPPFQFNARRGLTRRKKGSHYNRREPAALLHREWEPRPPPSA